MYWCLEYCTFVFSNKLFFFLFLLFVFFFFLFKERQNPTMTHPNATILHLTSKLQLYQQVNLIINKQIQLKNYKQAREKQLLNFSSFIQTQSLQLKQQQHVKNITTSSDQFNIDIKLVRQIQYYSTKNIITMKQHVSNIVKVASTLFYIFVFISQVNRTIILTFKLLGNVHVLQTFQSLKLTFKALYTFLNVLKSSQNKS
eukprot:TRINITY_DN4197_c0_g1_i1.p1 TRINITY_DN4197_c0_g1~~TRINITY_DN4197_c0_g1_i1.p1  ORF type:complete len:200 (+),score=-19.39 TRINITY_DN4197_c0_g1_i1:45-644(+)